MKLKIIFALGCILFLKEGMSFSGGLWDPFSRERYFVDSALVGSYQKGDKWILKFALPGFKKKEIRVEVSGAVLYIEATNKGSLQKEEKNSREVEEYARHYSQSLTLPAEVDPTTVVARLEDGILTLQMKMRKKIGDAKRSIPID